MSSFPGKFVEDAEFSPMFMFLHLCQKSDYLNLCGRVSGSFILFHWSISLFVCVSIVLFFLLLWLYSIIWNQVWWYLQWYSCCWGFIWLSWVFCAYIWSLRFVLLFLWRMSLWFLLELHWICEAQVIKAHRQKLVFNLKTRNEGARSIGN